VSEEKAPTTGSALPLPLRFLAAWLGGWFARALQQQVDYLKAENQVLKGNLAGQRLELTDADRRRLAVLAHQLGRKLLAKVATLATPDAILLVPRAGGDEVRWEQPAQARATSFVARGSGDYSTSTTEKRLEPSDGVWVPDALVLARK
jgi:hypothetical protein